MNPSDAKVWMNYAETDLRAAYALMDSGEFFPRQICFLAQQCAEKAIKAVLIYEEVDFPKNHDLDRLRDWVPNGWNVKKEFPDLAELTIWSVESRYPGDIPDAVESEHEKHFNWLGLYLIQFPRNYKNESAFHNLQNTQNIMSFAADGTNF